jgi:hypothetical protein
MYREAYHVKVVMSTLSFNGPHPSVQSSLSTQNPARPQSQALMTVVGQKPQIPFCASTRQSKPLPPCLATPRLSKPQVATMVLVFLYNGAQAQRASAVEQRVEARNPDGL